MRNFLLQFGSLQQLRYVEQDDIEFSCGRILYDHYWWLPKTPTSVWPSAQQIYVMMADSRTHIHIYDDITTLASLYVTFKRTKVVDFSASLSALHDGQTQSINDQVSAMVMLWNKPGSLSTTIWQLKALPGCHISTHRAKCRIFRWLSRSYIIFKYIIHEVWVCNASPTRDDYKRTFWGDRRQDMRLRWRLWPRLHTVGPYGNNYADWFFSQLSHMEHDIVSLDGVESLSCVSEHLSWLHTSTDYKACLPNLLQFSQSKRRRIDLPLDLKLAKYSNHGRVHSLEWEYKAKYVDGEWIRRNPGYLTNLCLHFPDSDLILLFEYQSDERWCAEGIPLISR